MPADEHLSPQQSGKYTFTHHLNADWHDESSWSAYKHTPEGSFHVASLGVTHHSTEHERAIFPQQGHDEAWHSRHTSTRWLEPGMPTPEAPLFAHTEHVPAHDVVESLYSTKRDRGIAPVMLGMAQNMAAARTGRMLQPSGDLSRHSSRMVQHLQGVGAVSEEAEAETTNRISWKSPYAVDPGDIPGDDERVVPQHEVESGRRTMRGILKAARPQRETDRGQQLRLFPRFPAVRR